MSTIINVGDIVQAEFRVTHTFDVDGVPKASLELVHPEPGIAPLLIVLAVSSLSTNTAETPTPPVAAPVAQRPSKPQSLPKPVPKRAVKAKVSVKSVSKPVKRGRR